MATTTEAAERDRLAAIPASYFSAVDSLDVDAVLEHFAEDATLTVQSARVTFSGHEAKPMNQRSRRACLLFAIAAP